MGLGLARTRPACWSGLLTRCADVQAGQGLVCWLTRGADQGVLICVLTRGGLVPGQGGGQP
jgi:hypothetical protein